MSFRKVLLPPDLSAMSDSSIVLTMYNCVEDGPKKNLNAINIQIEHPKNIQLLSN